MLSVTIRQIGDKKVALERVNGKLEDLVVLSLPDSAEEMIDCIHEFALTFYGEVNSIPDEELFAGMTGEVSIEMIEEEYKDPSHEEDVFMGLKRRHKSEEEQCSN